MNNKEETDLEKHLIKEFVCLPSDTKREKSFLLAITSNLNPEDSLGAGPQGLTLVTVTRNCSQLVTTNERVELVFQRNESSILLSSTRWSCQEIIYLQTILKRISRLYFYIVAYMCIKSKNIIKIGHGFKRK